MSTDSRQSIDAERVDAGGVDPEALADENRRIRRLRFLVDLTTAELMQSRLTLQEAQSIVSRVKAASGALFPDSEATFELLYRPRFERILRERFGPAAEDLPH